MIGCEHGGWGWFVIAPLAPPGHGLLSTHALALADGMPPDWSLLYSSSAR
jgi:hypothetical protein